MSLKRFKENPIIHDGLKGLEDELGENINGPTLIKVPSFVKNKLGKYYLYFAHHKGQYIRMAYSDSLKGPWKIKKGGVLSVEDAPCREEIASPEIYIDEKDKKICMYFHGMDVSRRQFTYCSFSDDGLNFECLPQRLGPFYFRVFKYKNKFYAIAKRNSYRGGGVLLESNTWNGPFKKVKKILPRMRHAGVYTRGSTLYVFYSRIGDKPERIVMTKIKMGTWKRIRTYEVLEPKEDYEGIAFASRISFSGPSNNYVRQLRDPYVYEEGKNLYLLYSNAGEKGICVAKMELKGIKKHVKVKLFEEFLHSIHFYRIWRRIFG